MNENKEELEKELNRLREELADMERALPAHTVRPHQLIAIEELEEQIKEVEQKLNS